MTFQTSPMSEGTRTSMPGARSPGSAVRASVRFNSGGRADAELSTANKETK